MNLSEETIKDEGLFLIDNTGFIIGAREVRCPRKTKKEYKKTGYWLHFNRLKPLKMSLFHGE